MFYAERTRYMEARFRRFRKLFQSQGNLWDLVNDLLDHTEVKIRLAFLLLLAVPLAGCQLCWQKPRGRPGGLLRRQSGLCENGRDTPQGRGPRPRQPRPLSRLSEARGWTRETGSNFGNPPGFFRGWEDEGPVRPDAVPQQVPTMEPR